MCPSGMRGRCVMRICDAVYLVDTNVISAGAPSKGQRWAELAEWMDANSDRLFLSTVSVAEIEAGIAKAHREGRRHAGALTAWLDTMLHLYAARVLPFDLTVARLAGQLADRARAAGHAPDFPALAIAATAQVRALTVLTRNVRHFNPLGVPVLDPFASLPSAS